MEKDSTNTGCLVLFQMNTILKEIAFEIGFYGNILATSLVPRM